jgi:hypothetical protein
MCGGVRGARAILVWIWQLEHQALLWQEHDNHVPVGIVFCEKQPFRVYSQYRISYCVLQALFRPSHHCLLGVIHQHVLGLPGIKISCGWPIVAGEVMMQLASVARGSLLWRTYEDEQAQCVGNSSVTGVEDDALLSCSKASSCQTRLLQVAHTGDRWQGLARRKLPEKVTRRQSTGGSSTYESVLGVFPGASSLKE